MPSTGALFVSQRIFLISRRPQQQVSFCFVNFFRVSFAKVFEVETCNYLVQRGDV
jgi:hypothetical protein